ncbi:hypothetical protein LTR94_028540, partial [Friedmanniomyces endolithicus]
RQVRLQTVANSTFEIARRAGFIHPFSGEDGFDSGVEPLGKRLYNALLPLFMEAEADLSAKGGKHRFIGGGSAHRAPLASRRQARQPVQQVQGELLIIVSRRIEAEPMRRPAVVKSHHLGREHARLSQEDDAPLAKREGHPLGREGGSRQGFKHRALILT